MKEFLEKILKEIVDSPDQVVVTETDQGNGNILFVISVAKEDMGKIIGKSGRIIKAIRDLMKILAVKNNLRVNVTLTEV